MRKLTDTEQNALRIIARFWDTGYCPGLYGDHNVPVVLEGLVKKKRVFVTMTDDGPCYSLTRQGQADAA